MIWDDLFETTWDLNGAVNNIFGDGIIRGSCRNAVRFYEDRDLRGRRTLAAKCRRGVVSTSQDSKTVATHGDVSLNGDIPTLFRRSQNFRATDALSGWWFGTSILFSH